MVLSYFDAREMTVRAVSQIGYKEQNESQIYAKVLFSPPLSFKHTDF